MSTQRCWGCGGTGQQQDTNGNPCTCLDCMGYGTRTDNDWWDDRRRQDDSDGDNDNDDD